MAFASIPPTKSSVPPFRGSCDIHHARILLLQGMSKMKNLSVWEFKNITKIFCGVAALSDVSMSLHPGETHGLLGCNGAGKSTLVRILSGHIQPDEGSILCNGENVSIRTPADAIDAGIAISTQSLMLFPEMSISDNLFLMLPEVRGHLCINNADLHARTESLLSRLGIDACPEQRICTLAHGDKYLIQFARCWLRSPRLLILDEISASLTAAQTAIVHEMIGELKQTGAAILYITHRTEDIMSVSDRITVLRDGKVVASPNVNRTSFAELQSHIFGETINKLYPKLPIPLGDEILRADSISNTYLRNISFRLRRGEILGVMGSAGSGRSRLLRAIAGIDSLTGGSIQYKQHSIYPDIFHDIAYIPENRDAQAMFLNLSCSKNITIKSLDRITSHGFIMPASENLSSQCAVNRLGIKVQDADESVRYLSDGNKQKVVIARHLYSKCSIYLFDEPTQGVDTVGKVEIYNIISELARRGAGIVIVSSDYAELLGMCDHLLILNHGASTAVCSPENVSNFFEFTPVHE